MKRDKKVGIKQMSMIFYSLELQRFCSYQPERRQWKTLCRTDKSSFFRFLSRYSFRIDIFRKFWFCTTNRLQINNDVERNNESADIVNGSECLDKTHDCKEDLFDKTPEKNIQLPTIFTTRYKLKKDFLMTKFLFEKTI